MNKLHGYTYVLCTKIILKHLLYLAQAEEQCSSFVKHMIIMAAIFYTITMKYQSVACMFYNVLVLLLNCPDQHIAALNYT